MRAYISRLVAAICVVCALAAIAPAQSAAQSVSYSRRYGIAYNAKGWDNLSDRYVEKRARKITRKHGEGVAGQFLHEVDRLRHIGEWIDAAYEQRLAAWSKCYNTGPMSPGSIFITLVDDFFTLPEWGNRTLAGAVVNYRLGTIQVVACAWNGSQWRTAPELIQWEIGNLFQYRITGCSVDKCGEIGSGDPCRAR